MNLKQTIRRILREEDYSPAGKEIIPNKIVVHKSNPMFRDKILEEGLKVRAGECYKIYVGYGIKCKPAIFATNSINKRAWFDSTYDDDVWEINTEMIPDVKWFKDRHYESRSKHIVTFQDIPAEAITLKYKGTGSGDVRTWDKDSPNIVRESIRRILREEMNLLLEVYSEDELKAQYLDRGLVSKEEFFQVISMFQKPFYRNWLLKRIAEKVIPLKNIKIYREYFKVFEKDKDSYPIKDLGLIKSEEDVRDFEEMSKNLINSYIDTDEESKNYISHNNIKKLNRVGIQFLGMTNNKFQVFMIPKSSNSNETWVVYKNILGNCKGREEGRKIEFCTMANFLKFSEYLSEANLYVLYNFSDQNSPYQFFYDGKKIEFRNNQNLAMRNDPEICNIYRFLHEKNLLDKIDKYELPCMTDEEINHAKNISNTKEKYHLYKKIIFDLLDDLFKRNLSDKEKEVINVTKYKEYNIINKYLIHLIYEFLSKEHDATLYDIKTITKIILEYYKSKLGDSVIFPIHNQGDLSIQERFVGINFFNGWGIKNFLTN